MGQRRTEITNEVELLQELTRRRNVEGYLVVLNPSPSIDEAEAQLAEAARVLRLNENDLKRALNATEPLPAARFPSGVEADRVRDQLQSLNLPTVTVPESVLQLNNECKQIRALILTDDSLIGLVSGKPGRRTAAWGDVRLVVQGRLFSQRTEAEENKRGRRIELVDKRELSSDASVLDIYPNNDHVPWRIIETNFDFSCLGARKRATAFENFRLLVDLLQSRVAAVDNAYVHNRPLLNSVWPLEQRVTKEHGRRGRARKFDLATITTTDNKAQFTRYSRLRHYLVCNESAFR